MSDVDFEFLYGGDDYAGKAKSLLAAGASLVVVTRGVQGAQAWHGEAGAIEVAGAGASTWSIPSAPATAFRRRCCSRLRAIGRIGPGSLAQMNAGRASPRAVLCIDLRGLHLSGAPAPIRRDHPTSARNCLVCCRGRPND